MGDGAELRYDTENAALYLGCALNAYHEALRGALIALAAEKGTGDLTWFDDLHQHAVLTAKGTTVEQVPIEPEASALRFGFEAIYTAFQRIRIGIVKE